MINEMVLKSLLEEACSRSNIPSEYREIAIHTDWADAKYRVTITWPLCVEGEVKKVWVGIILDYKAQDLWDINVLIDIVKRVTTEENA